MTKAVRRIAWFLACVLLFEALLIAVAPRLHSGSVLKIAKDSLLLRARTDSWSYMAQGDKAWREQPNSIYEDVFFQHGIRFIYPPTSLLLYRMCQSAELIGLRPFTVFKIILELAFLGTWIAACTFFFDLFPDEIGVKFKAAQRWTTCLLIAALMGVFLPLINALFLGQVQTILNFLLIASVLLWLRGHRTAAGILLGLACWLKPLMALFIVWGALRKQWNFVVSLTVMLGLGLALSCAVFGLHNTVEYLTVLQYLGRHGDALFTNQSLNGLLHRQMHVGSPVTWIYGYPPYNTTIYWATIASSSILLAAALVIPVFRSLAGAPVDFLLFAMAATMASPIAWEHHYGGFFLAFLLWMPRALRNWRVFFGLLAIYLLMTDTWAPLTSLMYTRWTFLISHVYFGGLLLFFWTLLRGPDRSLNPVTSVS